MLQWEWLFLVFRLSFNDGIAAGRVIISEFIARFPELTSWNGNLQVGENAQRGIISLSDIAF